MRNRSIWITGVISLFVLFPEADAANLFQIKNPDPGTELTFAGFFQADYRGYIASGSQGNKDLFLVRRARPYLFGKIQNDFDFRFMTDFGNNAVVLQDAFIDYHALGSTVQIRAGKFKQPFSYEEFILEDRCLVAFERSMLDQLTPARTAGVMVFGENLFDKRFDYALSISNGIANSDSEEPRSQKDLNARVAFRILPGLQAGFSGSIGAEQGSAAPLSLSTPMRVQWIQFNSNTVFNGSRTRVDPEVAFFSGPFGFSAQYILQKQDLMRSDQGPARSATTVTFSGYYAMATFLLTGEPRTSYARVHPESRSGAIELVTQLSGMNVSETNGLVDGSNNAANAFTAALGVNWYLNDWVWTQANFERAWFSSPVSAPAGDVMENTNSLGLRLALTF